MQTLAHSAKDNIKEQLYEEHINNVVKYASSNVQNAAKFYNGNRQNDFIEIVRLAAEYHDLGKLAHKNQRVLNGIDKKKSLPLKHWDAGTAYLWNKKMIESAILIYCHHKGLFSRSDEIKKGNEYVLRENGDTYNDTQSNLSNYLNFHNNKIDCESKEVVSFNGLTRRILLSCLVDADHFDTAKNYQEAKDIIKPPTKWKERLEKLDDYIKQESRNSENTDRNILRDQIYNECRNADIDTNLYYCDSPVGSGKTTAVMAHLLNVALEKELRHIIVVLPYTNIIRQSVKKYREILTLEGEKSEEIVAEHHHQVEIENEELRQITTLWKSPIIVTTAVQFFETLSAYKPAKLRKLHELAGSAVFVDEAHASIPLKLWPVHWEWIAELSKLWSCHFVFASGSLSKFWELENFLQKKESIPNLISNSINLKSHEYEKERITFPKRPEKPFNRNELIKFVSSKQGPRIVILNTVQSAAVIAYEMKEKKKLDVLHLSTALTPNDREKIIAKIEDRLNNKNLKNWTLVATSCVEAGVDFSFKTGFRETSSISSLIQLGGRANRHGEDENAEVFDFRTEDVLLNKHPAFEVSRKVVDELFESNIINDVKTTSELITKSIQLEIEKNPINENILKEENLCNYPEVAKMCKIIDADTRLVVIKQEIIDAIKNRKKVSNIEIMRNSVQLWSNKIAELDLQEIFPNSDIYSWENNIYESEFLGYMAGLIKLIYSKQDALVI